MKKLVLSLLAATATLPLLGVSRAHAVVATITSSGTWSAGSDTTDLSAPNAPWTLTLTVNSPLTGSPGANSYSEAVLSGSYAFGTTAAQTTFSGIIFYPTASSGEFDLDFANGETLEVEGAQIYDSNTLALIAGTYPAQSVEAEASTGIGDSTAAVTVAVPEPSTWALLGLSAVGAGVGAVRRRRPDQA